MIWMNIKIQHVDHINEMKTQHTRAVVTPLKSQHERDMNELKLSHAHDNG